jgi:hypothetical protein
MFDEYEEDNDSEEESDEEGNREHQGLIKLLNKELSYLKAKQKKEINNYAFEIHQNFKDAGIDDNMFLKAALRAY